MIIINTILPTRNKFVFSSSIKFCTSGFDKLWESIFCLLLVVEAFSLQSVVEILEEVVVGWWEVRWIWWMGQNFVAQFIQLLKLWLCDMWPSHCCGKKVGPFLLTCAGYRCGFWCISSICWIYFSNVMVSPGFRKLYWIRGVAGHQTVTMTLFCCKFGFGKCFGASSPSSYWTGHCQSSYKSHF